MARASSSAYVTFSPSNTTAAASGVRRAWAANSSGTVAGGISAAVAFHSTSILRRSSSLSTPVSLNRVSGSPVSTSITRRSRSANSAADLAVNTSADTITEPRSPAGSPPPPNSSPTLTSTSNLDTAPPPPPAPPSRSPSETPPARTPGRSTAACATFCTVSRTWNSGWRASERLGVSSSTSFSNGTSWWENADRLVSRTRASTWRKSGSPDRSVRRTSVLTKKPTRSSSATSVRPATTWPIGTSAPAPSRDSSIASAACTTMYVVTPSARATSASRACASAGISNGALCPRCEATGGRGRSNGSASSSGAPARASRQ
ncbi:hypothetical protein GCM10022419_133020 [Nonomuraea rosea]|uniref:Uncharacterized protein n=1 Tax=Nonomuraea rosea TaxID=638574 RepID=A0ABP7A4L2_9ACTN